MLRSIYSLSLLTLLFATPQSVSAEKPTLQSTQFPTTGILPKYETGALRFLEQHSDYDGRGVVVAIFDNGIDPSVPELQVTSDGKPKILDIIDGTGSGDVSMEESQVANEGTLKGISGRTLSINPKWKNPSKKYHVGVKAGYELFPEDLVARLQRERKEAWLEQQQQRQFELKRAIKKAGADKKELEARLRVLKHAISKYNDPGPIYDCVTFHDGKTWQAVVDTDEDGDLRDEQVMTNFRAARQHASFGEQSQLHYSVNIYDDGKLLSIVTICGDHGTHVAGIVAGYDKEHPERNGLAPGAQLISVKIGDTRLHGMETGVGLTRGLKAVLDNKCDLINMSYGEPSSHPNHGALIEKFSDIVREHGVVFVSSAGNSGPALSTVGSPGGDTSALIGVGAYVSPEMMATAYSIHKPKEGVTYSWSSRSPTNDGDAGVDIFAPGGAIAPIAKYTLRPTGRKHGTSMASPNACGNIALLLSGAKQEQLSYTPTSVKRAIQQTAKYIDSADAMSQGPGLLQVDQAFEWLMNLPEDSFHREFKVSVPSRNNARGIYLREPWETVDDFVALVKVSPLFTESEGPQDELGFGVPIRLEATEDWIEVGDHALMDAGGTSLMTRVNVERLKPGLHVGEIRGFHAEHQEAGPLFRIPVTITKPETLKEFRYNDEIQTTVGEAKRKFLAVPAGAQFAKLTVQNQSENLTLFYVHAVQLQSGRRFEELEMRTQVVLSENESMTREIRVVPGRTLEVCLGHFWMNQLDASCELTVEFGGLHADESSVCLETSGDAIPVSVTSLLEYETCAPLASVNKVRRALKPTSAKLSDLSVDRDGLEEHAQSQLLRLNYTFEQAKTASVSFHVPQFDQLLYESLVDSLVLFIFDEHEQLVATRDAFADGVKLSAGTYSLRLELRHTDADVLKSFEKTVISAEKSLGKTVSIPIWKTKVGDSFGREELQLQETATMWMRFPKGTSLPKDIQTGDVLVGTLKLTADSLSTLPLSCFVTTSDATSMTKKNDGVSPSASLREFRLAKLKSLSWTKQQAEIEELLDQLAEDTSNTDQSNLDRDARLGEPNTDQSNLNRDERLGRSNSDRSLHVIRLHLLDDDDRKLRLPEVVKAADQVIRSIKQKRLQAYFGIRRTPITAEDRTVHKQRTTEKRDLIDALYRKGRALAYMELPDVIDKHPIQNEEGHAEKFEKNFQALSRWVDTTQKEYALLHIRRLRRQGNFGQALEQVNKLIAADPGKPLYQKKRRDLYEELGWTDLQSNAHDLMLRRFPSYMRSIE